MWDQITGPADPLHVEAVVELVLDVLPRCGDIAVVAVDGRSGAGKTTLARGVAAELAGFGTVEVVHMDQLYPGWEGLAESSEILATRILEPLARASPAAYPRWDWDEDRWDGTASVRPADFLVVEGCGSSIGPARPFAAVTVFMEADRELRRQRGLARDGEAYRPHWQRWAAQEDAVFAADDTKARADLVIDTSAGGLPPPAWSPPT
ncbi:AAA family ATPase [Intrasporangium calvum]|uniref:Para-aminobenzoate synthase, subunit I n=1 Tax=Intrasporangium calvum (strain ATCC 23552 / DSM 43043 / JCM 3097 / NBRC 12989 / NCIMB 10167 / NRRL B-3866 / 7 KIP) TaxID=710696 RepID=E6S9E7_INTC7|nr:AAA family ATPase [Intrasporangium calvum]ADU48143.1 para-aminobenzoate synthase, subunit I [Intrasporangium calvum DSM 43043]